MASVSDEVLWKECSQLLKEFCNADFLKEVREHKVLLFRLYKLYLLHTLSLSLKPHDSHHAKHPPTRKSIYAAVDD